MYNVIIFGTGVSCSYVNNSFKENVKILCYLDNDSSKWGNLINNVPILQPFKISEYEYDFVIIASQFNEEIYNQLLLMNIDKNKIFQLHKFLDLKRNYVKSQLNKLINAKDKGTEVLVTGISYANSGIKECVLEKKMYKLTFGSQDIYYDYCLIKYLLQNCTEVLKSLKYVIIGLCYYSFQYDMSLSAMRNKVVLYYDILGDSHHFDNINEVYSEYEINKKIAEAIIRKREDGNYDFKWFRSNTILNKNIVEVGKRQALIDCNKNYPETVKENIQIFKEYLQLLKNYKIKPIVIVFPASKYYTNYFSKRIEGEFHLIINEVKNQYDFQYIDYFKSDLFIDDDFSDVSHLNSKGSEKFTKMLNDLISW